MEAIKENLEKLVVRNGDDNGAKADVTKPGEGCAC